LRRRRGVGFFADAWNLEAITPPWLRFRILEAPAMLRRGSLLTYRLRLFGLPIRWRTEIVEWRPPFGFKDVQIAGPYRRCEHTHRLRRVDGGTEIHDHLVYRLPYEPFTGLCVFRSGSTRRIVVSPGSSA
jgi:ligand-binding SRPBCC domain-containing protein